MSSKLSPNSYGEFTVFLSQTAVPVDSNHPITCQYIKTYLLSYSMVLYLADTMVLYLADTIVLYLADTMVQCLADTINLTD